MFILGKEKQLSTEDSTRQILLHATFVFEIKKQKRQAHFFWNIPRSSN